MMLVQEGQIWQSPDGFKIMICLSDLSDGFFSLMNLSTYSVSPAVDKKYLQETLGKNEFELMGYACIFDAVGAVSLQ